MTAESYFQHGHLVEMAGSLVDKTIAARIRQGQPSLRLPIFSSCRLHVGARLHLPRAGSLDGGYGCGDRGVSREADGSS
jgi:hypothetical protein